MCCGEWWCDVMWCGVSVQAHRLLEEEVEVVRKGMGHGELTPEVFTQVWEECYKEVRVVGGLCARVCVCVHGCWSVCVCWYIGKNMSYRFTVLVMEVQCCLSCVVFLRHSCLLCYPSSAGPLTGAVRA